MKPLLLLSSLLLLPLVALASFPDLPSGGQSLFSPEKISSLTLIGNIEGTANQIVAVEHPDFNEALEVNVPVARNRSWDTQFEFKLLPSIKKDDVLYVSFWLRGLRSANETGEVKVGLVIEEVGSHNKVLDQDFSAGREWRHYQYPVLAQVNSASSSVNFRVGGRSQKLQIAKIEILNFGKSIGVDSLPATRFTYQGRELDAVWRQAAAERIEKIRKGDLTLTILDAQNQPVSGANIKIEMQRHSFYWGTALDDPLFLEAGPKADRYRKILTENFNNAVPGNYLKWGVFERLRPDAIESVAKAKALGLSVRSHCMIWASWQGFLNGQGWAFLPRTIFDIRDKPDELRQASYARIKDVGTVFRGQVESIDVLNEPMEHRDLMKVLGEDEIAEWFKLARLTDPGATLVLNEAITFDWSSGADNLVRLAKRLDQLKAPVDALGIQAHYGVNLTGIDDVFIAINRFAATGKSVHITEFDMPGHDLQLHADYVRDFITIVFSHPSVTHFNQWGFSDDHHWRASEQAGLWDRDYNIKPAGEAYRDLVYRQFWTTTEGRSDSKGNYTTRGFAGTYKITVTQDGQAKEITMELPVDGALAVVKL